MKARWETKKIGEICDLMTGGTPSRSNPEYFSNGSIKWLVSGDIHLGEIFDCEGRITEAGFKSSNAKYLPVNSVLIALNGQGKTRGTVALLRTLATCNQSLVSINPKNPLQLLPEFLFYNLHGRYEEIRKLTSDADNDRRGLNMPIIRNIEVSFPPLPEQQRIVRILDEAFAGIAVARANAEKNLQNAREVFESSLRVIFNNSELLKLEKSLGEISEVQSGGTPLVSTKEYWGGNIPWYSSGELNSIFTNEPKRYITSNGLGNSNAKLFPKGSLLIGMYDTAALKMSILDRDGTFNQAIAGVKPKVNIDFEYILFAISAKKPKLLLERRGVRQKNLSLEKIKKIKIPLPDISVQHDIVINLREIYTSVQQLESIYQKKLLLLDKLTQSLLHHAFSGE